MRIDFSTSVSAFAFLWGASDNTWDLRAYDAGNNLIESLVIGAVFGSNAGDYFGIAAAGIAYATLTDRLDNIADGDYVFLDNFHYVENVSVPEPSSLGLLGVGLLAVGFGRRRQKN
jgi:PEP-CTERM motif